MTETETLQGIFPALITPFTETLEIDEPFVARLMAFHESAGSQGVVVSGTNGEGPSLSAPERAKMYELACEHAGSIKVIAGTATCSVTEAAFLARQAFKAGCSALMAAPPFYFKSPSQQGLIDFFKNLLDSSRLPVILYHIPQITQVPVEPELIDALIDHPNLIGVKDSEGDLQRLERYLHYAPRLNVYVGNETLLGWAIQRGGAGSISGIANAFPEWMARVWKAHRFSGDVDAAQALLNEVCEVMRPLPSPMDVKYALSLRGFPHSPVRPPLGALTPEQRDLTRALITKLGLFTSAS